MPDWTRTGVAWASVALLTALTACGESEISGNDTAPEDAPVADHYPLTVQNCGIDIEFDGDPERIALMETAPVPALDGLGLLDRVVVRAGHFPPEYYTEDLYAQIEAIPSLSEELDAAGHLALSQEEIIAHSPDLVLGMPDGASRAGLEDGGASVLEQEIYCPDFAEEATFDHVYAEIERYGEIFATQDQAQTMVDELSERVAAVGEAAEQESRTAAVLYPSVGGGPVYAYGTGSMAHPQLETLGFENVFEDTDERVFEVQAEELIGRDPDVLILLYQGDVTGVKEAALEMPGAETMTAVQNNDILTHPFNFTEPATPLSVDGLELIADHFQDG